VAVVPAPYRLPTLPTYLCCQSDLQMQSQFKQSWFLDTKTNILTITTTTEYCNTTQLLQKGLLNVQQVNDGTKQQCKT
jgi:hypothetical protein